MILVMQTVAGKDATNQFHKFHRGAILNRFRERLMVGTLKGELKEAERSGFGFGFLKKKKA
jgi:cytochrome b involved in lipid metabolism